jgi:hypothetical protein
VAVVANAMLIAALRQLLAQWIERHDDPPTQPERGEVSPLRRLVSSVPAQP